MTSHTDAATIADELHGKLFDQYLIQKIDGCRRCQEKNEKRRCAADQDGVDMTPPVFEDGDAVIINAVRRDDLGYGPHWVANSVYHHGHPQLPFEDGIVQGTAQARARARIHVTEKDKYIVAVDVREVSPAGEGPEQSVIQKRQQQHLIDDDQSNLPTLDRDASDAPAHWPDVEREWLHQLEDEHGPLKLRTVDMSAGLSLDDEKTGK